MVIHATPSPRAVVSVLGGGAAAFVASSAYREGIAARTRGDVAAQRRDNIRALNAAAIGCALISLGPRSTGARVAALGAAMTCTVLGAHAFIDANRMTNGNATPPCDGVCA